MSEIVNKKIEEYIDEKDYKNAVVDDEPAGCCTGFLLGISRCVGCIYSTPFTVLKYITIAFCFVIPFVVAYCY